MGGLKPPQSKFSGYVAAVWPTTVVWLTQGACIVTREVRIAKYFIHVSPWILTRSATASESTDWCCIGSACAMICIPSLSPYNLSILKVVNSHGCMITFLVVCCISMVSSWFSVMSCSEITRGFQPPRSEQNVQFCRFLYCAHDSVCNTIRSPCDETWTRCPGVEIQSSVMDFDIWCSNL